MVQITGSAVYDAVLVLAVVILVIYKYYANKFTYWEKRGVPFPRPLPIVGNFLLPLLQKRSPGQFLWDIYKAVPDVPFVGFYIFRR